jgi:hypothetical protein
MKTINIIPEYSSIKARKDFIKSHIDLELMASQWRTWKYEVMHFSNFSWMSTSCASNLYNVMIEVDRIHYKALNFIESYRYIPLVELLRAVRIATVSLNRYWITLLFHVKMENSNEDEMNEAIGNWKCAIDIVDKSLDGLITRSAFPDEGRVRRTELINAHLNSMTHESIEKIGFQFLLRDVYTRWDYKQSEISLDESVANRLSKRVFRGKVRIRNERDFTLYTMKCIFSSVVSQRCDVEIFTGINLIGQQIKFSQVFDFIIQTPRRTVICLLDSTCLNSETAYARALIGCDIAAERYNLETVHALLVTRSMFHFFRSGIDVVEEEKVCGVGDVARKLKAIITE